jgi:hypothetical protein
MEYDLIITLVYHNENDKTLDESPKTCPMNYVSIFKFKNVKN